MLISEWTIDTEVDDAQCHVEMDIEKRRFLRYLTPYLSFSSTMAEKGQNIFKTRLTKNRRVLPKCGVVHKCVPRDGGKWSSVNLSSAWSI